jgi:hypothetical protein
MIKRDIVELISAIEERGTAVAATIAFSGLTTATASRANGCPVVE